MEKEFFFSQDINDAKEYCQTINYSGSKYKVVLMVRINPERVRIVNRFPNKDYMIVNGEQFNNNFGTPKIDEVRLYKILLKKE